MHGVNFPTRTSNLEDRIIKISGTNMYYLYMTIRISYIDQQSDVNGNGTFAIFL